MEVFKEGESITFGQLPTSVHISGAIVLVGEIYQIKLDESEAYRLLHFLEPSDPAWDNDDGIATAGEIAEHMEKQRARWREEYVEHRLHENARMAMRELMRHALENPNRKKKSTMNQDARTAYAVAHAMQTAFEQTQGGFTEAPASSETEAAVAHRETDVFVVMAKLGPFPIERDWLEEKKILYPTLDVYHEVRQACDKLNERGELSRIANGVSVLSYLERCLMAMAAF